jgi:hypothetical protein
VSWHFSQALAAEFSADTCSAGEPSAPWSSTPIAPKSSCSAKMTGIFHRSQSGMMFVPSTDAHGAALLTSFLAAFRARTSARPDAGPGLRASGAVCGRSSLASLAKWDRDSSSWKTPQCSLVEGSDVFSGTWPRWGLMLAGECWGLATPVRPTNGNGFGYLPTLVKYDATPGGPRNHYNGIGHMAKMGTLPTLRRTDGDRGGRGDLIQALRGNENSHFRLMPTLTRKGNYNRKGASPQSGDGLATALSLEGSAIGGPLNPTWCEWFMGWPMGWTALEPLATDKFRRWSDSHGKRSAGQQRKVG